MLHRKIRRKRAKLFTPEKPWDLPSYVLDDVEAGCTSPQFKFQGKRLRTGANWRFVKNPLVDDEAGHVPEFVDAEAVSTSQSESTEESGSVKDSSRDGSRSDGGEEADGEDGQSVEEGEDEAQEDDIGR